MTVHDLILSYLRGGPATAEEIAEEIGKTSHWVRTALRELRAENYVMAEQYGMVTKWMPVPFSDEKDTHPAKQVRKPGDWVNVPFKLDWWERLNPTAEYYDGWRNEKA